MFDKNDRATGVSFDVQLKATDEADVTKALRVDLKRDRGLLPLSSSLPVLVVRLFGEPGPADRTT